VTPGDLRYPTVDEIHAIHDDIVAEYDDTARGTRNPEAVRSALTYVSEGYFGKRPETIHEKAAHLLRLLIVEYPYVDGNKRTALSATETFYAMNGYVFAYDDAEIRAILRDLATDADAVDLESVVDYARDHTVRVEG
jgi:death on curing protein